MAEYLKRVKELSDQDEAEQHLNDPTRDNRDSRNDNNGYSVGMRESQTADNRAGIGARVHESRGRLEVSFAQDEEVIEPRMSQEERKEIMKNN